MLEKVKRFRIVRLVKFLFSREKKSRKTEQAFPIEYGFQVIHDNKYNSRVLITKNDIPYCQFDSSDAKFYNPGHTELKDVSIEEKCYLWSLINEHDDKINGLTFLCESF